MVLLSELNKDYYKSGEVAKFLHVSTRTVQNYCKKGILQEIFTETNRRMIPKDSLIQYLIDNQLLTDDSTNYKKDVIYARVSTHKQKNDGDLTRQVQEISNYVITKNPRNLEIITEVCSGLNDNRKKLLNLLNDIMDNKVNRVFISHKDRLTRFGFNYLETICTKYHTEIIIVSNELKDKSIEEELAEDIISVIHYFSGKLYGLRSKIKQEIDKELDNDG